MSGRRGRPTGARPFLEKGLKTPKIGQGFHQQPFAPIFQQLMGGGASQGAGSQHDPVDRSGGETCAQDDHPPTQEEDACYDSDDHGGEDSEEMDSAAASPGREYSQKRGW